MMTASPSRRYSGHHKTAEDEGDHRNTWRRDLQKEMWLQIQLEID